MSFSEQCLLFFYHYWHCHWHSTSVCEFVIVLKAQLNVDSCHEGRPLKCVQFLTFRDVYISLKQQMCLESSCKRNLKNSQGQIRAEDFLNLREFRALINSVSQTSHWMRICLKLGTPPSFGQILFLTADFKNRGSKFDNTCGVLNIKIINEDIC